MAMNKEDRTRYEIGKGSEADLPDAGHGNDWFVYHVRFVLVYKDYILT